MIEAYLPAVAPILIPLLVAVSFAGATTAADYKQGPRATRIFAQLVFIAAQAASLWLAFGLGFLA